jgi:hypothetical protein
LSKLFHLKEMFLPIKLVNTSTIYWRICIKTGMMRDVMSY